MKQLKDTLSISILIVLFLLPVTALAQRGMFEKALKEKRIPGFAYQAKEQESGPMVSSTHNRNVDFCNDNDYVIIKAAEVDVTQRGNAWRQYLLMYDFVPKSEYAQYKKEVNTLKSGGLLDYTNSLPVYPTDEKSRKKAEKLYSKAERRRSMDLYHEAAQLGHVKAKIEEARWYLKLRANNQNKAMARHLVDELILLEDPAVWDATYDIMSKDGKAYVDWRRGKNQEVPFRFLWSYKGRKIAEQKLRESAEKGSEKAQQELGKMLWHGEYLPQNKKEAIKWILPFAENNHFLRDYVFVAKGEGVYNEEIPDDWYNYHPSRLVMDAAKQGNPTAKMLLSYRGDRTDLMKEVEKGNGMAAKSLDAYLKTRAYVLEKEMLTLLNNAQKTKYDKYGADVKLIEEIYQDAIKYNKAGKKERFDDRHEFANNFVTFYTKYPKYDKKHILKKAKLVNDFCQVTTALYSIREDPQLWEFKREGFLRMDKRPTRNPGAEERYWNIMNNAVSTCKKNTRDAALGKFFSKSIPLLKQKMNRVNEFIKKDNEDYNKEVDKYNKMKAEERRRREETETANSVKVPAIIDVIKGDHGRFYDTDDDFDDTDIYKFSDYTEVVVHHRYRDDDLNYYYADNIGQMYHYRTAVDAANAAWVYKKLKIYRTKGKED